MGSLLTETPWENNMSNATAANIAFAKQAVRQVLDDGRWANAPIKDESDIAEAVRTCISGTSNTPPSSFRIIPDTRGMCVLFGTGQGQAY